MFGKQRTDLAKVATQIVTQTNIPLVTKMPSVSETFKKGIEFLQPYLENEGEDLVLVEDARHEEDSHIRDDYIMHPISAIRKTNNGRLSIDTGLTERFDVLPGFYMSRTYVPSYLTYKHLGNCTKRFITDDGFELFTLNDRELLEVNGLPYQECSDCHEIIPTYDLNYNTLTPYMHGRRDSRLNRTYKVKKPLQDLIRDSGLVVTKIEHPCFTSLQDLLGGLAYVDPPNLEIVFPKDISY